MNRQELTKQVAHYVHVLVYEKGYASPLDILLKLDKLTPKLTEEWRFGRLPYLEKVTAGNLSQLEFILDTMRKTARDMGLKEHVYEYKQWGKGRGRTLRFSKTGNPHIERKYATSYRKEVKIDAQKSDTTRTSSPGGDVGDPESGR